MRFYTKTLIIIALACLPFLAFSQKKTLNFEDEKPGVELIINGEKFVVGDLPRDGIVEVFNILGSKMMTFSVKGGVNTTRVNLPEGYYILKGDNNATKKIVVK